MTDYVWKKSSRSGGGNGACVEVGGTANGATYAVRDTKDRKGGTLRFNTNSWVSFVSAVKDGSISR